MENEETPFMDGPKQYPIYITNFTNLIKLVIFGTVNSYDFLVDSVSHPKNSKTVHWKQGFSKFVLNCLVFKWEQGGSRRGSGVKNM